MMYETDVHVAVLCPTDKALSRINLTHYLNNKKALQELVQLHIIPLPSFDNPNPSSQPLLLSDAVSYPSLLDVSQGGSSQYGQLAFRRTASNGWIVGIKDARGQEGEKDFARIVDYGRATPWFLPGPASDDGRLASGGGVLLIDSVIIPYYASWWRRIGWILVAGVILLIAGAGVGYAVYMLFWGRKRGIQYDRLLENEED